MRRDRDRGDAELLSAYVDGVAELSLDERKRIDDLLARDPALRADEAATRELLGQLRELPPVGGEPDWTALERSIGDAVGRDVPVPWYQRLRWRWIVPAVTLAAGAALVALVMHDRTPAAEEPAPTLVKHAQPAPPAESPSTVPLWLDGASLELDADEIDLFELEWELAVDDAELPAPALVPPSELALAEWIDELDADELDVVEEALDERPREGGPS